MQNFNDKSFSLVLTYGKYRKVVSIPYTNKGYKGKKVGGSKTYLMAIDAYTTKFANKDELLNDIRKKRYADIKGISNGEIKVQIVCTDKKPFGGNLDLVFSDNKELVDFIQNNEIKANFPTSDCSHANKYVKRFIEEAVEKTTTYKFNSEYRKLILNPNKFYRNNISQALVNGLSENNLKFGGRHMNPIPFYEYYNIRGHAIFHQTDFELLFRENAYYSIPRNELGERENIEELKKIRELKLQKNKIVSESKDSQIKRENPNKQSLKEEAKELGIVSEYSYLMDPEHQMEMLNRPFYEEEIEDTIPDEEYYYNYLSTYEDYLQADSEVASYEQLDEFNYSDGSKKPPIIMPDNVKKHK